MTDLVFRMPDNISNEHHVNLAALFVSHKKDIKERSTNKYHGGVEHKLVFHNNECGNDFFRAMLDKGISVGGYVKEKEPNPHDIKAQQESKLKKTIKMVKMRLYGG
jgi:hypothetical protein